MLIYIYLGANVNYRRQRAGREFFAATQKHLSELDTPYVTERITSSQHITSKKEKKKRKYLLWGSRMGCCQHGFAYNYVYDFMFLSVGWFCICMHQSCELIYILGQRDISSFPSLWTPFSYQPLKKKTNDCSLVTVVSY